MQFLIDIALSLIYFGAFLILCAWTWRFWKMYVNQKFLNKLNDEFVMLEIRLPREIFKSPLATEVAISSMLQGSGVGNWYQTQFLGNLPLYASLEIASIEGVIHFYVRVLGRFKELVEENFYAQYPGIEITGADDYTKLLRYVHLSDAVSCWGEEYTLGEKWAPTDPKTGAPSETKKMRADFYPIKTYTDYELEKNPKEEFKVDPISVLMEFMGSLGKGEHLWYQIIFQDEKLYDGKKMPKILENPVTHEHWTVFQLVDAFKKQVRGGFKPKGTEVVDQYGYKVPEKTAEGQPAKFKTYQSDMPIQAKDAELTMEQKWMIEMANKKLGKPLTMATIRMMYVVDNKKGKFNGQHIQKILSYPKPYAGANSLAFKTATDPYSYPWERMGGKRVKWRTEEMFDAYVEREAFFPHVPERKGLDKFEDKFFWNSSMKTRKMWRLLYEALFHPFNHPHPDVFALNLEEIATLWHLPGTVVTTPTLPRIDSAKAVAPVNLPQ